MGCALGDWKLCRRELISLSFSSSTVQVREIISLYFSLFKLKLFLFMYVVHTVNHPVRNGPPSGRRSSIEWHLVNAIRVQVIQESRSEFNKLSAVLQCGCKRVVCTGKVWRPIVVASRRKIEPVRAASCFERTQKHGFSRKLAGN